MEAFFKDLSHSLRMFRRNPGFTIAAVAALPLVDPLIARRSRRPDSPIARGS